MNSSFAHPWSLPIRPMRRILPVAAMLLLLAIAILVIWLSYRFELEEKNRAVIADALWVQQSVEFQLNRNLETMQTWAQEIVMQRTDLAEFRKKADILLRNRPELVALQWLDAKQKIRTQVTHKVGQETASTVGVSHFSSEAAERAGRLGQATYSQIYSKAPNLPEGRAVFDLHLPLIRQGQAIGTLVMVYSLAGIVEEHIPWWFAQEYAITLTDADGTAAITRSAGGAGRDVFTHQLNIELPGLNLRLKINSIHGKPQLIPNILSGVVVLLSLILVGSVWALWRDISRRAALDQALAEQYAFRKAMEDSLVTGLRARDLAGKVTYVNPAFCAMTGYSAQEMVGQAPPMPYWAPEAMEDYNRRYAQILDGTISREGFETIFKRKNGERFHALVFEAPLIDASGQQTGWMSSILDISSQKQIERLNRQQQEKLQSAARLNTMGELATTLSHELNQPLSAISSYSTACLNLLTSGKFSLEDTQDLLRKVNQQAQRAGLIIRSVNEFVRKRPPQRVRLNLSELITHTLPLIELQTRQHDVRLETSLPVDLPEVYVDRVMIEQVLLNLTRNGIEAMQGMPVVQRHLSIRVQAVPSSDPSMLEVVVADQGAGIAPEIREQLFSGFFSTKTEGMGMGLNICRTAIEYHGGRLYFEDNPQGGTVFFFTLPGCVEAIVQTQAQPPSTFEST